jgi:hypothetical protein
MDGLQSWPGLRGAARISGSCLFFGINLQNCSFVSGFVGSKMWFHILRAEHKLQEFGNRVLSRIFELKGDEVEMD